MILKIFQFHQKFIKWFLWLITFHLFAPQPTCFAASDMSVISALIQWSLQYGEKQLHRQPWTCTLNEILECRALRAWLQLPLPQVHLSAKITVFNYLHFRRIQKSCIGRVLHKNENKKWNLNSTAPHNKMLIFIYGPCLKVPTDQENFLPFTPVFPAYQCDKCFWALVKWFILP